MLGKGLSVRTGAQTSRVICLLDELWGEMFEPLKDESVFATARQSDELGTVVWGDGADFRPEFLLDLVAKELS